LEFFITFQILICDFNCFSIAEFSQKIQSVIFIFEFVSKIIFYAFDLLPTYSVDILKNFHQEIYRLIDILVFLDLDNYQIHFCFFIQTSKFLEFPTFLHLEHLQINFISKEIPTISKKNL
jgi:hypothetical protein